MKRRQSWARPIAMIVSWVLGLTQAVPVGFAYDTLRPTATAESGMIRRQLGAELLWGPGGKGPRLLGERNLVSLGKRLVEDARIEGRVFSVGGEDIGSQVSAYAANYQQRYGEPLPADEKRALLDRLQRVRGGVRETPPLPVALLHYETELPRMIAEGGMGGPTHRTLVTYGAAQQPPRLYLDLVLVDGLLGQGEAGKKALAELFGNGYLSVMVGEYHEPPADLQARVDAQIALVRSSIKPQPARWSALIRKRQAVVRAQSESRASQIQQTMPYHVNFEERQREALVMAISARLAAAVQEQALLDFHVERSGSTLTVTATYQGSRPNHKVERLVGEQVIDAVNAIAPSVAAPAVPQPGEGESGMVTPEESARQPAPLKYWPMNRVLDAAREGTIPQGRAIAELVARGIPGAEAKRIVHSQGGGETGAARTVTVTKQTTGWGLSFTRGERVYLDRGAGRYGVAEVLDVDRAHDRLRIRITDHGTLNDEEQAAYAFGSEQEVEASTIVHSLEQLSATIPALRATEKHISIPTAEVQVSRDTAGWGLTFEPRETVLWEVEPHAYVTAEVLSLNTARNELYLRVIDAGPQQNRYARDSRHTVYASAVLHTVVAPAPEEVRSAPSLQPGAVTKRGWAVLRDIRRQLGLTRFQFGERLRPEQPVHVATISRWENAQTSIPRWAMVQAERLLAKSETGAVREPATSNKQQATTAKAEAGVAQKVPKELMQRLDGLAVVTESDRQYPQPMREMLDFIEGRTWHVTPFTEEAMVRIHIMPRDELFARLGEEGKDILLNEPLLLPHPWFRIADDERVWGILRAIERPRGQIAVPIIFIAEEIAANSETLLRAFGQLIFAVPAEREAVIEKIRLLKEKKSNQPDTGERGAVSGQAQGSRLEAQGSLQPLGGERGAVSQAQLRPAVLAPLRTTLARARALRAQGGSVHMVKTGTGGEISVTGPSDDSALMEAHQSLYDADKTLFVSSSLDNGRLTFLLRLSPEQFQSVMAAERGAVSGAIGRFAPEQAELLVDAVRRMEDRANEFGSMAFLPFRMNNWLVLESTIGDQALTNALARLEVLLQDLPPGRMTSERQGGLHTLMVSVTQEEYEEINRRAAERGAVSESAGRLSPALLEVFKRLVTRDPRGLLLQFSPSTEAAPSQASLTGPDTAGVRELMIELAQAARAQEIPTDSTAVNTPQPTLSLGLEWPEYLALHDVVDQAQAEATANWESVVNGLTVLAHQVRLKQSEDPGASVTSTESTEPIRRQIRLVSAVNGSLNTAILDIVEAAKKAGIPVIEDRSVDTGRLGYILFPNAEQFKVLKAAGERGAVQRELTLEERTFQDDLFSVAREFEGRTAGAGSVAWTRYTAGGGEVELIVPADDGRMHEWMFALENAAAEIGVAVKEFPSLDGRSYIFVFNEVLYDAFSADWAGERGAVGEQQSIVDSPQSIAAKEPERGAARDDRRLQAFLAFDLESRIFLARANWALLLTPPFANDEMVQGILARPETATTLEELGMSTRELSKLPTLQKQTGVSDVRVQRMLPTLIDLNEQAREQFKTVQTRADVIRIVHDYFFHLSKLVRSSSEQNWLTANETDQLEQEIRRLRSQFQRIRARTERGAARQGLTQRAEQVTEGILADLKSQATQESVRAALQSIVDDPTDPAIWDAFTTRGNLLAERLAVAGLQSWKADHREVVVGALQRRAAERGAVGEQQSIVDSPQSIAKWGEAGAVQTPADMPWKTLLKLQQDLKAIAYTLAIKFSDVSAIQTAYRSGATPGEPNQIIVTAPLGTSASQILGHLAHTKEIPSLDTRPNGMTGTYLVSKEMQERFKQAAAAIEVVDSTGGQGEAGSVSGLTSDENALLDQIRQVISQGATLTVESKPQPTWIRLTVPESAADALKRDLRSLVEWAGPVFRLTPIAAARTGTPNERAYYLVGDGRVHQIIREILLEKGTASPAERPEKGAVSVSSLTAEAFWVLVDKYARETENPKAHAINPHRLAQAHLRGVSDEQAARALENLQKLGLAERAHPQLGDEVGEDDYRLSAFAQKLVGKMPSREALAPVFSVLAGVDTQVSQGVFPRLRSQLTEAASQVEVSREVRQVAATLGTRLLLDERPAYIRLTRTRRELIDAITEGPDVREVLARLRFSGEFSPEEAQRTLAALRGVAPSSSAVSEWVVKAHALADPDAALPTPAIPAALAQAPYAERLRQLAITTDDPRRLAQTVWAPLLPDAGTDVIDPTVSEKAVGPNPILVPVHSSVFRADPTEGFTLEEIQEELRARLGGVLGAFRFVLVMDGTSTWKDANDQADALFSSMSQGSGQATRLSREHFDLVVQATISADALLAAVPHSRLGSVVGPRAWAQTVLDPLSEKERSAVALIAVEPNQHTGGRAILAGVAVAVADGKLDPLVAKRLELEEVAGAFVPKKMEIAPELDGEIKTYQAALVKG